MKWTQVIQDQRYIDANLIQQTLIKKDWFKNTIESDSRYNPEQRPQIWQGIFEEHEQYQPTEPEKPAELPEGIVKPEEFVYPTKELPPIEELKYQKAFEKPERVARAVEEMPTVERFAEKHDKWASLAQGFTGLSAGTMGMVTDAISMFDTTKRIEDELKQSTNAEEQQAGMALSNIMDTINPTRKVNKTLQKYTKSLFESMESLTTRKEGDEKGVSGLFAEKRYKEGLDLSYRQTLQSAPISMIAMASVFGGVPYIGMGTMFAPSYGQKMEELSKREDLKDMSIGMKRVNSFFTGVSEAGSEYLFALGGIAGIQKIIGKVGITTAKNMVGKQLGKHILGRVTKYGVAWTAGATAEGIEEFANAVATNFVDNATGVKTDWNLFENSWESFVSGTMSGFMMESPMQIAGVSSVYQKQSEITPIPEIPEGIELKAEEVTPETVAPEELVEVEGLKEPVTPKVAEKKVIPKVEKEKLYTEKDFNRAMRIYEGKISARTNKKLLELFLEAEQIFKGMNYDKNFEPLSEVTRIANNLKDVVGVVEEIAPERIKEVVKEEKIPEPSKITPEKKEVVREAEIETEKRYRHKPLTQKEGWGRLDDLTPAFGKDIYTENAVQYFGTGEKVFDKKSVSILQSVKGKPEQEITIYRSIEKGEVKNIKSGDWVTVNKDYAVEHGETILDGKYEIIEKSVKVKDLTTSADSINEQGYYPTEPKIVKKPEKQAWEMTKDEYLKPYYAIKGEKLSDLGRTKLLQATIKHEKTVKQAIKEGKTIPSTVLKDYKDLEVKYAEKIDEMREKGKETKPIEAEIEKGKPLRRVREIHRAEAPPKKEKVVKEKANYRIKTKELLPTLIGKIDKWLNRKANFDEYGITTFRKLLDKNVFGGKKTGTTAKGRKIYLVTYRDKPSQSLEINKMIYDNLEFIKPEKIIEKKLVKPKEEIVIKIGKKLPVLAQLKNTRDRLIRKKETPSGINKHEEQLLKNNIKLIEKMEGKIIEKKPTIALKQALKDIDNYIKHKRRGQATAFTPEMLQANLIESYKAEKVPTLESFRTQMRKIHGRDYKAKTIREVYNKEFQPEDYQKAVDNIKKTIKDEKGVFSFKESTNESLISNIKTVAIYNYNRGMQTYTQFRQSMRKTFTEIWDKIKNSIRDIYNFVKAKVKEEAGYVKIAPTITDKQQDIEVIRKQLREMRRKIGALAYGIKGITKTRLHEIVKDVTGLGRLTNLKMTSELLDKVYEEVKTEPSVKRIKENAIIRDIKKRLQIKTLKWGYQEKINDIKKSLILRKQTKKQRDALDRFAKFVKQQQEEGIEIKANTELLNDLGKKYIYEMNIKELEHLRDVIKSTIHQGYYKNRLINKRYVKTIDEIADKISEEARRGRPKEEIAVTIGKKERVGFAGKVKEFDRSLTRMERFLEHVGLDRNSEAYRQILLTLNNADNQYVINKERAYKKLHNEFKKEHPTRNKMVKELKKIKINKELKLTPNAYKMVYIYSLTDLGTAHLIEGNYLAEQDLRDIENTLTQTDKDDINYAFKLMEKYYPEINNVFKKIHGVDLPKRFLYFHFFLTDIEAGQTEFENMSEILEKPTYITQALDKGMLKKRVGGRAPMVLDFWGNITQSIDIFEKYKAMALAERDVRKIINHKTTKEAIRKNFSDEWYNDLKQWFGDIIGRPQFVRMSPIDKIFKYLRFKSAISLLYFNATVPPRQTGSLVLGISEAGLKHAIPSLIEYMAHPSKIWKTIYEKDPIQRYRRVERDLAEMITSYEKTHIKAVAGKKGMFEIGIAPVMFFDKMTVNAVWWMSYKKYLHENKKRIKDLDVLEKKAVEYAQYVVRKTQPAWRKKDLPSLFRSKNEITKMMTMFQNYPNQLYNYVTKDSFQAYKDKRINKTELISHLWWSIVVSSLIYGLSRRWRLPDEEEALIDLVLYPLGMLPMGRDYGQILEAKLNKKHVYANYTTPPLIFFDASRRMIASKKPATIAKYGIKTMAFGLGIPYSQPYRTYKGITDLVEGETDDLRRIFISRYALEGREREKVISTEGEYGEETTYGEEEYGESENYGEE